MTLQNVRLSNLAIKGAVVNMGFVVSVLTSAGMGANQIVMHKQNVENMQQRANKIALSMFVAGPCLKSTASGMLC